MLLVAYDVFPVEDYELPPPVPVLTEKRGSTFLLEIEPGRYYVWNMVGDAVKRIDQPESLEEILKILEAARDDETALEGLKSTTVEMVSEEF